MPVRAVVDTNIIVSAFLSVRGASHQLLQELYVGSFHLIVSAPLLGEYEAVLARPGLRRRFALQPDEIAAFFRFLARRAEVITLNVLVPLAVRDRNDEHVLATAIASRVPYLVSGDDDLLALGGDPHLGDLQIVTPSAFLAFLREESSPS